MTLLLPTRRALVQRNAGFASPSHFYKSDSASVAFTRTGLETISLKADTEIYVAGTIFRFPVASPVTMPTHTTGTDYAIYACADGALVADANFSAPSGYTAATSRQIGGYHYAAGGNATGQGGGDTTPQINPYSLWDQKWRPACPDPRGMVLVAGMFWCDTYFANTDPDAFGTSRYGATIADGSSPPKIPLKFGGDGSTTYGNLTQFTAAQLMAAVGKHLLSYEEFQIATFGTSEQISRGNDPITTGFGTTNVGSSNTDNKFTSKWGVVQSSGCLWIWGRDKISKVGGADYAAATTFGWKANTGGRGSLYLPGAEGISAARFGANWDDGSASGSRASFWNSAPWASYSYVGARGRSDHLFRV